MTPSEVAELKRLAEEAGWNDKWEADGEVVEFGQSEAKGFPICVTNHEGIYPTSLGRAFASFIAAANPVTIRALIAENEAKDAEIERLRAEHRKLWLAMRIMADDEESADVEGMRNFARQALTGK